MPTGMVCRAFRYHNPPLDWHHTLRILPFPPDTRGFLYYHIPQSFPPTAGEIRFRLTRDGGPEAFDTASDLIVPTGLPWSVPLWRIASFPGSKLIQDLLIKEKLVSEDVLVRCREFGLPRSTWNEYVVHALGQSIPVSPGRRFMHLRVVSKGPAQIFKLQQSLAYTPSKEALADGSMPADFFHVCIEHDPRRHRFTYRVVAKYDAQSRTLVPLKGEPTEIRSTATLEGNPYGALSSLIDETLSLKTLEQRASCLTSSFCTIH